MGVEPTQDGITAPQTVLKTDFGAEDAEPETPRGVEDSARLQVFLGSVWFGLVLPKPSRFDRFAGRWYNLGTTVDVAVRQPSATPQLSGSGYGLSRNS
jgi:hypothetical protein